MSWRDAQAARIDALVDGLKVEPWLGSRFFQRLSDKELLAWRPSDGRFHEGNFSACNKEIERRAAKIGMRPLEWVHAQA